LYCNLFCLHNKDKQGRQNKFKSGGTDNLRAKRAEKEIELLYAELAIGRPQLSTNFAVRCPGLYLPCKYVSIMAMPYREKWPLGRPEMAIIYCETLSHFFSK